MCGGRCGRLRQSGGQCKFPWDAQLLPGDARSWECDGVCFLLETRSKYDGFSFLLVAICECDGVCFLLVARSMCDGELTSVSEVRGEFDGAHFLREVRSECDGVHFCQRPGVIMTVSCSSGGFE